MDSGLKIERYLTLVEDCLLNAATELKSGKSIDADGIQVLLDGVRIFHHFKKIRENS